MPDNKQSDEQKTERFNMFLSPSEMKAIDDWAWRNKIRSKSEAVRRLVQIGVTADVGDDKRTERVARALCVKAGINPDKLEPGDVYGVDGIAANGDPCHFMWRQFADTAQAAIAAL